MLVACGEKQAPWEVWCCASALLQRRRRSERDVAHARRIPVQKRRASALGRAHGDAIPGQLRASPQTPAVGGRLLPQDPCHNDDVAASQLMPEISDSCNVDLWLFEADTELHHHRIATAALDGLARKIEAWPLSRKLDFV